MAETDNCFNCVYSHWDRGRVMWTMSLGVAVRPTCGNQPDFPGRMRECPLGQVCRNFRARPPAPAGETVKTIPLGDGFYAYVDAADYEWLSQWTWTLRGGYAVRQEKGKAIYMHRQIVRSPKGKIVDHKNLNKLDNTRANLRNGTRQENTRNRGKQQGTSSRFKGVCYSKRHGKYFATVYDGGKGLYLGLFTDEIKAARAYDHKAVELFGEFARVNFPEEWPVQRRAQVRGRSQASRRRAGKKAGRGEGKTAGRRCTKRVNHREQAASAKRRASGHAGRGRAKA